MTAPRGPRWTVTCTCGKRSYTSRKDARHAAKSQHPNERLQPYRCDDSDAWHYGHVERLVVRGVVARHG